MSCSTASTGKLLDSDSATLSRDVIKCPFGIRDERGLPGGIDEVVSSKPVATPAFRMRIQ